MVFAKKYMFCLALAMCLFAYAQEQGSSDEESFYDIDVLNQMTEADDQILECTPEELVSKLVDIFHAPTILQQPIYLASNSPLTRSIHDLPIFSWVDIPCQNDQNGLNFYVDPFYNQTSKMFFTDSNPFIDSYINLTGTDLIDVVTQVIDSLALEIKPREVLPLFQKIKLQERKVGLYGRLGAFWDTWSIFASSPFYYLERNFFLTPQEANDIRNVPFLSALSAGSSDAEVTELMQQHLLADKLGLGDLRIHCMHNRLDSDYLKWSYGIFLTLPTAISFKEGIIGGSFCKRSPIPSFTIQELASPLCEKLTISEQLKLAQQTEDYAFAVLDRLTANVADTSLGNNGHVAIGTLIENEYNFYDAWGLRTQGACQYLFPGEEERYFLKKIDPKQFSDAVRHYNDPAFAQENLDFFNEALRSALFPTVARVQVQPGVIVQFNTAVTYTCQQWRVLVGYDFWWQQAESFDVPHIIARDFQVGKALNTSLMQNKIFGRIDGIILEGCENMQFGIAGDYTFSSRGLGKDFTLAFNIELNY